MNHVKLVTSEDNYIASQKSCEDLEEQLAEQQQQYDELQEELALTEQECSTINKEKVNLVTWFIVHMYTKCLLQLELEENVTSLSEELEKHQSDLNKKDEHIVQLTTQLKHLQDVSPF